MKNTLLGICFVLLYLTGATSASAQIVGANVFLKGNFVEVGANTCGAYGTPAAPPAGYHPTETGLGFVADWESDGWDTGTPDYCGDYFVPGSPVEGWQLQIGSDTWANTDQSCFTSDVPGDVTDYSYAGGIYTGVWEGSIASENLSITQITTLPEDKLYFVTRILLCNDGATPIEDVYYMRNVDPDNDQPWSGDFTTENVIVYQPPADDQALVTSEGLTFGCFLGIGARDTNARVSYGNFATTAGTPEDVWFATGGYSGSGTSTADEANSISFYVPIINPGECKCVAFAYILNVDDLEEALEATVTYNLTVDGEAVASGDTVYICEPGDPVELAVLGADDYEWTWSPSDIIDTDTGSVVIANPTETVTITAVGVGGFCGDASVNVTLLIDEEEFADAGVDQAICFGLSTTIDGDGGDFESQYSWSPTTGLSDPTIANPEAAPTSTTTYTLTTLDIYGCPATDEVTVVVNPLPDVSAGPDQEFCVDGVITLEASGAVTYEWSPEVGLSDPNIANPECTVDDETTYTVTGTDANGCINTDEVNVSVNYLPEVIAVASPYTIDVFLGQTSQLSVTTGGVVFEWFPTTGLSNPTISNPVVSGIPDTTVYVVTVTDINGCVSSDTVVVNAIGELVIGLPTAFSPNNDGINDLYAPVVDGSGDLSYFAIYNRWGQLIHEGASSLDGWDGTVEGKPADVGTYVVVARARTSLDEERSYQGYFTLIR